MNRQSESTESKGFTLLELLVVLVVFTFIIGRVFDVLGRSQKRYQFEQDVTESQQMARNCVEIMERELRLAGFPQANYYDSALGWTASNSNRVARKFVAPSGTTTSPTHMVFEGDIDEDGIVEVVEYRLSGGAWSGALLTSRREEAPGLRLFELWPRIPAPQRLPILILMAPPQRTRLM